jgi:circadian clock protein KaiB
MTAMAKIRLKLYVTGMTPAATQAIASAQALEARLGAERLAIETIDVLDQPLAALNDDVYATPTLIRVQPEPVRRVFGSLASVQALVDSLELET